MAKPRSGGHYRRWPECWAYLIPDSAIRCIVENGYHSPAKCRVNGVVRNIDAWYEAFGVEPDATLYLPKNERVRTW